MEGLFALLDHALLVKEVLGQLLLEVRDLLTVERYAAALHQLVTMLYRYADAPEAGGTLDAFADADTVSAYAVDAMRWAAANGIVNGSHGRLNPQGNATRAQVAAMLMRFCEKMER